MRKITTLDGIEIFPMGLGTYPFQGEDMCRLVENAVSVGYRLFDTADDYRGETGIGMAVERLTKSGRIKRENLFLQTKISADASYNDEPLAGVYFNKYSPFGCRTRAGKSTYFPARDANRVFGLLVDTSSL